MTSRLTILAALLMLAVPAAPAAARPGDLDPGFGSGGFTHVDPAAGPLRSDDVAVRPDGRIVLAGTARAAGGGTAMAISFLSATGVHERTTTLSFGEPTVVAEPAEVALAADGAAIVAGSASDRAGRARIALARLLPDGTPDPAFGTGGRVLVGDPARSLFVYDLALDRRGRIVVAGEASGRLVVLRFRPDGTLDPTFGGGGSVTSAELPAGVAVEIDARGRLLVLARRPGRPTFLLVRLRANGRLDRRYGRRGFAGRRDRVYGGATLDLLAVPRNGTVVAATTGPRSRLRMTLLRYDERGRRDRRFGRKGIAVAGPARGRYRARSVVRQRNGRFVLIGTSGLDVALARVLPSGRVDRRFGRRGWTRHRRGDLAGTAPDAGALQGRGRLIVAGTDTTDDRAYFSSRAVVARFEL